MRQNKIISNMKFHDFLKAKNSSITIFDSRGDKIGNLIPVGSWILRDEEKIELVKSWRQKNMKMFFTHFQTSYDLTHEYLSNFSINQDNRILFLIYDELQNLIGHMGLANLENNKVELDNLMRGTRGGHPKLIYFSELALLNWSFEKLGVSEIYVRFFSYNWISVNLHKSAGFVHAKKFPVIKYKKNEFIFHEVTEKFNSNVDYEIIEMSLNKDNFYKKNNF